MKLSDWLKQERARAGMSQDAMSSATGVPLGTIKALEQGATTDPNLSTFLKLWQGLEFNAQNACATLCKRPVDKHKGSA